MIPAWLGKVGHWMATGPFGHLGTEILATGGKVIKDQVETMAKVEPRHDFFFVLSKLHPSYAARLREWHQSVPPQEENQWVKTIGTAFPRHKDGTLDLDRAIEVMAYLARVDEAERAQTFEMLKHDPVAQKIKYWIELGSAYLKELDAGFLSKFDDEVLKPMHARLEERVYGPQRRREARRQKRRENAETQKEQRKQRRDEFARQDELARQRDTSPRDGNVVSGGTTDAGENV